MNLLCNVHTYAKSKLKSSRNQQHLLNKASQLITRRWERPD